MLCPQCRFENREEVKFCEDCGAKIELVCPACKANIPPGRKFCGECGYDLSKSTEAEALKETEQDTQISESPPEETIPTHIPADGERKHVTVLFSDLTGSRSKSLCTCPRSLTTQGPTASRRIDTGGVAFHLVDSGGTLKFTTSFAVQ